MAYIIISDIHANLEALFSVIQSFSATDRKVFCLGDIVGYGPEPERCLEEIRALAAVTVLGNHDSAVIWKTDMEYFNPEAREALMWTREHLSRLSVSFLEHLPYVYEDEIITLVHGTLNEADTFHYMLNGRDAMLTFEVLKTKVCFVGHSHIPGVFFCRDGRVFYREPSDFRLQKMVKYIVNVGSVGQPRDYDRRACYCVYDPEQESLKYRRVEYNIGKTQRKMAEAGLPYTFIRRLSYGY